MKENFSYAKGHNYNKTSIALLRERKGIAKSLYPLLYNGGLLLTETAKVCRRLNKTALFLSVQGAKGGMVEKIVAQPLIGIIMGSVSDWDTMRHASEILTGMSVPHEVEVVSAHRTPDKLFSYAESAENRGLKVIIAGAGGAAHLPGMTAAKSSLPVLGVPVQSAALSGMDSLLSIVQMPAGVPVGTLAIGRAGAVNAALLAVSILCTAFPDFRPILEEYRRNQTDSVLAKPDPRVQTS